MRCPWKKAQKREQQKALGDILAFLSEWIWEDGKKIKKNEGMSRDPQKKLWSMYSAMFRDSLSQLPSSK